LSTALLWFRRDLRLDDNPALAAALAGSDRLLPLYIYEPEAPGGASRWWLEASLTALDAELHRRGSRLFVAYGASEPVLRALFTATGARRLLWNHRYEPAAAARDAALRERLEASGITVERYGAALLGEPWEGRKEDGTPYRVFTPYWRARQRAGFDLRLWQAPAQLPPPPLVDSADVSAFGVARPPAWAAALLRHWQPGAEGARQRLESFAAGPLADYATGRDTPAAPATTRISPHLAFGEVSPRRIATVAMEAAEAAGGRAGAEAFLRQLGWREFAYHLLYHFPDTPDAPLNPRFLRMAWRDEPAALRAWQRGETGVPLVDAGMRELWTTGWMHNRVRMVTASWLSKHLLLPWQAGARWFMETLVDADLANNTLGWQWVAGCGADAAPWFRILNPVRQGERFDPEGRYVRRWLPALRDLPSRWVHCPWRAPTPPGDYPPLQVGLREGRERALAAYRRIGAGR